MEPVKFDDDKSDVQEIQRAISILFDSQSLVELRVLKAFDGLKSQGTVSGYFDGEHHGELVEAAAYWSGKAPAVYVTLNPVLPDLLARSKNRARAWMQATTRDNEVTQRRWLLIDFDPKRPSGISAVDAEHEAALDRARKCREWLREQGWPDPILADSGNGAHLLYRIDLPNDNDALALVKRCLEAVAAKWSDESVEVDRSVHNAARICKLYGTLAAKGDETPERPHRIARMLDVPEAVGVAARDVLAELCQSAAPRVARSDGFDLQAWIAKHRLPVGRSKDWEGGTLWELDRCPWRPDEKDGGAFVAQRADGSVFAGCHHSKCHDKGWPNLRDIYDPGWRTVAGSAAVEAKELPDDPHRLARLFLDSKCQHPDGLTLRYWCGEWYRWNGILWKKLADVELEASLMQFVKAEFDRLCIQARASGQSHYMAQKVTSHVINNVSRALRSELILSADINPPAWLDDSQKWPADEVLVAKNGLVHLPSFCTGTDYLLPHTPRFFALNGLDYAATRDCGEPNQWRSFLNQLWPNDLESISVLQQWFGYCLTNDTRHQKILLVIGPKRSGKGTIGNVLRALVGTENVAGPTFSSLATQFGLQSLLGKTVAIIPDGRLSNRLDTGIIVERLLSISGEDSLTVDRKHREALTTKLKTRFTIFSNELPPLADVSGAIASRMVVLQLVQSFYGNEDRGLVDKLYSELPGILLWAAEGWKQLRHQGRFREPATASDLRLHLDELSSPTMAFIEECCHVGPGCSVPHDKLFVAYQQWCQNQGRRDVEAKSTFGKNLRAALPSVVSKQISVSGKKQREYVGIALLPE